jgi:hypothetical protein
VDVAAYSFPVPHDRPPYYSIEVFHLLFISLDAAKFIALKISILIEKPRDMVPLALPRHVIVQTLLA